MLFAADGNIIAFPGFDIASACSPPNKVIVLAGVHRQVTAAIGIDQIIASTGFDIDGAVAGDHAVIAGASVDFGRTGAGEHRVIARAGPHMAGLQHIGGNVDRVVAVQGDDFDDLPAAGGDDAKTQVVDIDKQPIVGAGYQHGPMQAFDRENQPVGGLGVRRKLADNAVNGHALLVVDKTVGALFSGLGGHFEGGDGCVRVCVGAINGEFMGDGRSRCGG